MEVWELWPVLMVTASASFSLSGTCMAENDEQSSCFLPAVQSPRVQASPPALSLLS